MSNYSERLEAMLNGAFVLAWKLIKRNTEREENPKLIKLTEIKMIEFVNKECCYFNTYKDVKFITYLNANELTDIINKFIFKQDDFYYEFVEK